ncbi:3-ketoacyl-CoA synthase 6-like [Hibiscus syriacus]|uniref:3-ketoacyl-CoA synthase 6-like n=1 Tax=Hibiscus syriacus TaxID=106335 RepID=A0A6A2ZGB2_HIBSY|nr:uncharacterized protein LOC120145559 [Hibiscus syriacus]KAE8690918.1 3-ketoacyl-CoA synthase 6-like [Hibiscus syriacus]
MYVTRPFSMYKQSPSLLSSPPPEGPNSGVLVILDEEDEPTCCFGLCKSHELDDLPFPQNKNIEVRYSTGAGKHRHAHRYKVTFIPVLGQPLSSNRYYALQPRGRHKGEAFTNSTKEDAVTCCFCLCYPDIEPQPADHHDMHQQFEICRRRRGSFFAKSVSPDGVPPGFLKRKGWQACTSTPRNFTFGEAPGLDATLRAQLPQFDFPLSCKSSQPVVVGKWYCPFIFIKDGTPKDQMTNSMYYKMSLEQRWEQVFACNNDYNKDNRVVIDTRVEREVIRVNGMSSEITLDDRETVDGTMWFGGSTAGVGLSLAIIEKMKSEEERFGWNGGDERVKREEKMEGNGVWNQFGCYVLVERFVLRRMDESLALTYDFKHTHVVRNKWE